MTQNACQRLWQVEATRDGRLAGADLANALRHRAQCADCQRAALALDQLARKLKTLPVRPTDELVQKRTRQVLLSAWNEHLLADPRPRNRPRIWLIAAFSAIVGLALAIGYPLVRSGSRHSAGTVTRQNEQPGVEPNGRLLTPAVLSSPAATLPQPAAMQPELPKPAPSAPPSRIARPKRARTAAAPSLDSAEDDAYLEIVNLLRNGRRAEARAKASQYLLLFPSGFRRLEVQAIAKQ